LTGLCGFKRFASLAQKFWPAVLATICMLYNNIMTNISDKPTILWDGDCGFCKSWIARWKKRTKDAVHYIPYQKAIADFPQVTAEECKRAIQLIMPDGSLYSGAHAVFKALSIAGIYQWLLWFYEQVPLVDRLAEWAYQSIARNRSRLSKFRKHQKCETDS